MKFSILYVIIYLVSIIVLSCNQKEDNLKSIASEEKGDVVLIFENIPLNWKHELSNGVYSHNGKHEVEYSIDGIIPTYFFPKYSSGHDTLIIKNIDRPLEIEHKYKGHGIFSFIARPLDTLLFTYQKGVPLAKYLNDQKKNEYHLNYESLIRKKVYIDDFSSFTKWRLPSIFFIENVDYTKLKPIDSSFKSNHFKKSGIELKQEKKILDSLIREHLISDIFLKFYDLRIKYRIKTLEINEKPYVNFTDFKQNDSLLKFSFYRNYINAFVENSLLKNVKNKKSANSSIPNPEEMYEFIKNNKGMSDGTKKYLSFLWFEKIIKSSSNEKINYYFKLFKLKYGQDKVLIEYISDKYNLSNSFSNDLLLKDEYDIESTFNDVLNNNKGKLIYLDFWASWCAPCREAMKSSNKLRNQYMNKDIVFIYLAINDDFKSWKNAIIKEELSKYKHSYFITNSKTSSMVDSLRIETLPRYMIFSKDGILLQHNAPGPKNDEIKVLFEKYLKR